MAVHEVNWWSGFLPTWEGITTLGTVQTIKKAARVKKMIYIPSFLLFVQDFQQSHVIRDTGTELKDYRRVLGI